MPESRGPRRRKIAAGEIGERAETQAEAETAHVLVRTIRRGDPFERRK